MQISDAITDYLSSFIDLVLEYWQWALAAIILAGTYIIWKLLT